MKKKWMPVFGCAFSTLLLLSIDCRGQIAKTLYLSKEETKNLLTSTSGAEHKIIFQFYLNSSNELTLYAWPKKRANDENNNADLKELHIGKDKEIKLNGQNVLLGNLNLAKKRIDTILNDLNNTTKNYKYIIFDPVMKTIGSSPINHLHYTIYGITGDITSLASLTKTRITDTRNPSPPRKVN
ncbi:hypothetical protein SNE25_20335 [Mucilaginibacter sabulilitoris]|uniref:Lipoprotein n=1 Tax=Mucilaginibacter sabulilitoris TaxID=1173583 RepID=A0ABZ0TJC4_9SPHI|nr:hypothetical protein [Mucilaginibacter sabulilitoris]WPU91670.1 hypothetical protein SNE25_20335 [Mucilaginibacter sabulilitoris]